MSLARFIKLKEELEIVKAKEDNRQKVIDYIKNAKDLDDSKYHEFVRNELGMEEPEGETLAYTILQDMLKKEDEIDEDLKDDIEYINGPAAYEAKKRKERKDNIEYINGPAAYEAKRKKENQKKY